MAAASGATAVLAPAHQPASTVANNLYVLSGSGALLMTFVEPFQSFLITLGVLGLNILARVLFRAKH